MSEKTRYFRIGLFTLISLILFVVGLVLFGAGAFFQAPPLVVETYFNSSVQGLDIGAPVKMSGVRIGKVKEIMFVKDVYGKEKGIEELGLADVMVYVKLEVESKYFPRLQGLSHEKQQAIIDLLVERDTMRTKLQSIGITGLVYVEIGYFDPNETPAPIKGHWTPTGLYIPSAPGVASRLGESLDKMLNKMDTVIYPMLDNFEKASAHFPEIAADLSEAMPHIKSVAKNVDDITSVGKKYPSQMIFGEAPAKSRYGS